MTHDIEGRLQAYAEAALAQWTAPVVGPVGRISDGWESELYTLDIEYGPQGGRQRVGLVLRLYPGEGAARKAEHEFNGMRKLHQAGYPVPWVHHLALADSPLGQPFILMDRIDGAPLWPDLAQRPPAEQQALLALFSALFVRLHQLDWRPFAADPAGLAAAGPLVFAERALSEGRAAAARFALPGFVAVVDWLDAHRDAAACAEPAVVHRDFHPANVLLRADGTAAVIDWSGLAVSDARFDLAWTLMLAQSHAGAELRAVLLAGYERAQAADGEPGVL